MRPIKKAIAITASALVVLSGEQVKAYPPVEMEACLSNAFAAVVRKGLNATASDVKNYCHCALSKIIDQGKDINRSVNYCNLRYMMR